MTTETRAAAVAPLLVELLNHASLEIAAGNERAIAALHEQFDPGTEVFINFLPDGDYHVVGETAVRVRRAGFNPVPHIVARSIADRPALADFLSHLAGEAGVERVLLVAGDRPRPAGAFASTMDVLATGLLQGQSIKAVGVAGHPEGHPTIGGAAIDAALMAKRDAVAKAGLDLFIVTQFAFEAQPILDWLARTRLAGIDAPIRIGVAGPATVATLVKFGMRCGIGNSLRAVRMRTNTVGRLLGNSGPEDLLADLAAGLAAKPDDRVAGIHFFPFGGIAQTSDFVARTLSQLYRDIAPAGAVKA